MYEVILLLLVYIIAISYIAIMNKISPGNRMYTAWVAFVCVALTACNCLRSSVKSSLKSNVKGKNYDKGRITHS